MSEVLVSRRALLKASVVLAPSSLLLSFATDALAKGTNPGLVIHYLRIDTDGNVIVTTPVAEIGQGTSTGLPMILAEALDADWTRVRFELASVAPEFVNPILRAQLTGASTGIAAFHDPYRDAGLIARTMLITAAAAIWKVPASECETQNGRVLVRKTGKSLSYGQLAVAASKQPVPKQVLPAQPRTEARFVKKPIQRLDIPSKVDGSAKFTVDVRLPDMLYATVAASPVFGGRVARDQRAEVLKLAGVRGVVDLPGAVAIVADRWWIARKALDVIAIEWAAGENDKVSDETISTQLWNDLSTKKGVVVKAAGNAAEVLKSSDTLVARYEVPFLAHTTMEPMSCVAKVDRTTCDVWVGSQLPDRARQFAAKLTGLPEESVTIHSMLAGGGFGRRQEPDFVSQAVLVAKNFPGRPVKLIWTREEDVQHDYYRPAGVSELSGTISGKSLVAIRHRQATPTILPRMYPAFMGEFDSVVTDAIWPMYDVPNMEAYWVRSETHVPTGMWRSVGASQTVFALESFVDELAHKAGVDPYQFRRQMLQHDPRALAALDRLAKLCGWSNPPAAGRAIGMAISHKNLDCLVAQSAEVSLVDGKVVVHKICTVADPGRFINPDTTRAQLEGAAIWGLSSTLNGKISIKDGRVQESNFFDYTVVRLAESPAFQTEILESGAPIEGVGEGGSPGVAPAVCNAVFRLTGKRIRRLPIGDQLA